MCRSQPRSQSALRLPRPRVVRGDIDAASVGACMIGAAGCCADRRVVGRNIHRATAAIPRASHLCAGSRNASSLSIVISTEQLSVSAS